MFLKSLILRGFKTFADQTEIIFADDARITAIVGPNGCGKSNLMDATRWVLAEDNPRELRVASLSNIIFAGTASRKSLSLAEVTMIFDNESKRFPIPFSEVAIKRRTFKEGESEFFINKNPCRLKDIKELLLDTGLGESTYSIITQGQVDAILSSKGEERRAVFEEAAGINKYKTRKESAQRKLISAEQNILRISDLKIEVAEHIITLEDQAKKARHYKEIQENVKNLDLGLAKRQVKNILEKQGSLTNELEQVRSIKESERATEEQDFSKLSTLKETYRKLESEIDATAARLEGEKDKLRDLELERRFLDGELAREEKSLKETAEKTGRLKQKINELEIHLAKEQKGFDLSDTVFSTIFEEIIKELGALVTTLKGAFASMGEEKSIQLILGHSLEKEESYKLKIEMLKEEVASLEHEQEKLTFGLKGHQIQLESLNKKISEQKASQGPDNLLPQKREERETLSTKIDQLEEKIRHDDRLGREKRDKESSLEIALAKLDGELAGLAERISLEYNLSLAELENKEFAVENAGRAKKEIEAGKEILRQLEPVNLLAIEEFDKEKERFSFIQAQLNDLNSARENLTGLITELDQKAEETFLNTMKELATVFSETFAKLFVGGEAKISLQEGVPPLDAEINIEVRPKGRKWLPLPLLSGGERSMSAIAILFSLLTIRPSPFVFMDEVDAALDDANIGRFTEMLKAFAQHSQIIVITHNKRTMAVADNIYGVTMEEPGMSKVISMKLSETAK